MGTDNVISIVHRRARRIFAEISSPAVEVEPEAEESIDAFVERVGEAIAGSIRPRSHAPSGRPRLRVVRSP